MSSRFADSLRTAAIISVVLSSWCLAQDDKAEPAKPKAIVPPPKITISKETTWATEPLRPDGFVDYLEVVNRRSSKNVTIEKNACVLLYQAMGPNPDQTRQQDRFFRRMGIEPLPDEGEYFQSWGQLVGGPRIAIDRPWTAGDFPDLAAWLKSNELPLATLTAATQRPRYFSPLVNPTAVPDGGLLELSLPGVHHCRQLARALLARAMWELAEGSQVDAWRDLMTVHRLGRLVGQGPTLIESLVGFAIESLAFQAEFRFLSETKPSTKMLSHYRKQLARLPARASIADKFDLFERLTFLDCAQRVAHGQLSLQTIAGGDEDNSLVEKLAERAIAQTVDWNELLKSGNKWYDRLAEIAREQDFLERSAAIRKLDQELKVLVEKRREPMASLPLLGGKPAITQAMSDTLISHLHPAVGQVLCAEGRAIQRMHNLELAFTLAQWRNEHDSYPESLDKLAPNYIPKVPKDHFNDQSLKYERIADGYRF